MIPTYLHFTENRPSQAKETLGFDLPKASGDDYSILTVIQSNYFEYIICIGKINNTMYKSHKNPLGH